MVGTHVDITDYRWKAEREMESQLLFQRSQRFESMGVLAGGVAHDFNNHLMSIMGNLELAALELPSGSPALEFLDEAMVASHQSAELCRQMLAYAGRTAMRVSQIDLTDVLRDTSSLIQAAAGGHTVVDIAIPPVFPAVRADALEIQQVLMNLVTNAVEATEGQGANVSVSAHAAWCPVDQLRRLCFGDALREGMYAFLRVADNGCGMVPEVLDKAFEPFFTTKFQGRGLGLAASLGIARALGGSISLRSEPGKGTIAELILPVVADEGANAEEPPRPALVGDEEWRGEGCILLVDDDVSVRDVAGKMLERAGYEVVVAESGRRALELFQSMRGKLRGVLLDWAMPDLSGEKVLDELNRTGASVPVVLTTGYSQSELADVLTEGKLSGIVHKPFSYERLRSVMRTATAGPT
jgi:nitrogen-specific signal transduction histidine kinase/CheY-like chemotaxis protein